jgi:hypothetical protein
MTFTTAGSTAVTHIGTYDAVTAGNYEIGAALASSVTAVTITFAVGAISFSASLTCGALRDDPCPERCGSSR